MVHNSAKYIDPTWGGGTVPAAIPELVLALSSTATCIAVRSRGSHVKFIRSNTLMIALRNLTSDHTSSMTISAALRTDSMTSPRALHTPTCPGVSPLSRAHGAAPDTGLERGSLARELGHRRWGVVW